MTCSKCCHQAEDTGAPKLTQIDWIAVSLSGHWTPPNHLQFDLSAIDAMSCNSPYVELVFWGFFYIFLYFYFYFIFSDTTGIAPNFVALGTTTNKDIPVFPSILFYVDFLFFLACFYFTPTFDVDLCVSLLLTHTCKFTWASLMPYTCFSKTSSGLWVFFLFCFFNSEAKHTD